MDYSVEAASAAIAEVFPWAVTLTGVRPGGVLVAVVGVGSGFKLEVCIEQEAARCVLHAARMLWYNREVSGVGIVENAAGYDLRGTLLALQARMEMLGRELLGGPLRPAMTDTVVPSGFFALAQRAQVRS